MTTSGSCDRHYSQSGTYRHSLTLTNISLISLQIIVVTLLATHFINTYTF